MAEDQQGVPPKWEQSLIAHSLEDVAKEIRSNRRWRNFFRIAILIYILFLFISFYAKAENISPARHRAHTALVDITGPIMAGAHANADNVTTALRRAYADDKTRGIILRINSPGGSPVQADYIYNEVMRLRKEHPKIKVYAVCTDMCTSAAYYIASAANEIYADPSTLVGSIGVLIDGFGFVGAMHKLGIQRRLLTAGKNKGSLDPFSPMNASTKAHIDSMLGIVHHIFISKVEAGRGKRLKIDTETFSGRAWTGETAKKMGLVDGFASPGQVARDVIHYKSIVNYTVRPDFFEKISDRLGLAMAKGFGQLFGLSANGLHFT